MIMNSNQTSNQAPVSLRGLSIGALVFATLGGVYYWWLPLGIVMSLTGLVLGLVDWMMARRRSLDFRLSIVAVLVALAALALGIFIGLAGLQTVTFGGQ
jgi:hypothetical protein